MRWIQTLCKDVVLPTSQARVSVWIKGALQVALGSVLLAILAQFAVPLPTTPVLISLQSLGVMLLGLTLGPKKAPAAVLLYLGQASLGWPVLQSGANPAWILGPTAGYLVGFLAMAYLIALLQTKWAGGSFLRTLAALTVGELALLTLGSAWLSVYVGVENALLCGMLPFLVADACKIIVAATLVQSFRPLVTRLLNRI